MQMQSRRRETKTPRTGSLDRMLCIEVIKGAFTRAGLEQDYHMLVDALGEERLARTMTERWLYLTIRDLLGEQRRDEASASEGGSVARAKDDRHSRCIRSRRRRRK